MDVRRGVLIAAAAVVAAGCTSWRRDGRLTAMPAQAAGQRAVRVTRADGGRVVLRAPRLAGDTLVAAGGGARVAVADVRRVDRRRFDADRTIFLYSGYLAVLYLVAITAVR